LNAEVARQKSLYRDDRERLEAFMMSHPIDLRSAYAYFGLMIGIMPLLAWLLALCMLRGARGGVPAVLLIFIAAGAVTGIVGYLTGRFVATAVERAGQFRQPNRIMLIVLTGLAWGAVSGAAGGLLIFIVGAIFAAIIGGVIGALCLPVIATLFGLVRKGDLIELKHFLPITLGTTLSVCAFVVGFVAR